MNDNVQAVLEGLNAEQKKAVEQLSGPVLIVAGAGSGKTRVLTARVANLLAHGVDASHILALTFTKKAASEMRERIITMVGYKAARGLVAGTFHSVFVRFLRDWCDPLGYPKDFTIHDQSDSQSLIKTILKEMGLDDKTYKPKTVLSRISEAKNNLVSPASYMANPAVQERDRKSKMPRTAEIYDLYWKACRKSGVMDFDDILFNMNILLRDSAEALSDISSRFSHILVDEYQDTNRSQYLILKKLAVPHRNICVVGDDSQSIYAFRGARIENILNFRKDYPETAVFRLEQNYRSTSTIVEAANSLIAHNSSRIPKTCFSEAGKGELIRMINAYTDQEEASLVVSAIRDRLRSDRAEYQDFAVLYRTNAQSRVLEEELRRRNVPYMIYSGNSFFERAEVKDMMAYLKLACNPGDDESFRRIVNRPARGIGQTTMEALSAIASSNGASLMQTALSEGLIACGMKAAAVSRLRDFALMIMDANSRIASDDAHTLALSLAAVSGTMDSLRSDTSVEGQTRLANVEELLDSILSYIGQKQDEAYEDNLADGISGSQELFVSLPEYLENIALLSAVDTGEDGANKVALMTVHSSKGLEFPYVFIVGMEENLFPGGGLMASPSDIEEERRLFYVAITRAKKTVALSCCASRIRNGEYQSNPLSRFVREIDPQYFENPPVPLAGAKPAVSGFRQYPDRGEGNAPAPKIPAGFRRVASASVSTSADFAPSPVMELAEGQRVEHGKFGLGTILEITGGGTADLKAKIAFDHFGEKVLLLRFAKLRIV